MKKSRVGLIIFFFSIFLIILIIRIIFVSLVPDPKLVQQNTENVTRGKILGRNGEELAVGSYTYSFYARTSLLSPRLKTFLKETLSRLNFFEAQDLARLDTRKGFIWIKRRLTLKQQDYLQELIRKLKDDKYISQDELGIIKEQSRYYPYPFLAGIVGVVGIDSKGLMGLEYQFDTLLSQGYDIYTTVDPEITRIANDELIKSIHNFKAESGSVVMINPRNGEIVAMAGYPLYDPNDLDSMNSNNIRPVFNSTIYEPGSVMKQFSAAFALENNLAQAHSPRYWCGGTQEVGDHSFSDGRAHGWMDLSLIIQKSCNVGMVQVARDFDRKEYYKFLYSLGFGNRPEVALTELEKGILHKTSSWSFLSKYMLSIGQEIGVTSLQLAIATSVIGSGGTLHQPYIVKGWKDMEGHKTPSTNLGARQVISPESSAQLLSMMKTVVSEQGTAIQAKVEGISIAGKTGTGQVARSGGGGYYPDLFNAVFTGYIPADQPSLVMVIAIHKPRAAEHTGGIVAAPVFANIVRRMIISTSYFNN